MGAVTIAGSAKEAQPAGQRVTGQGRSGWFSASITSDTATGKQLYISIGPISLACCPARSSALPTAHSTAGDRDRSICWLMIGTLASAAAVQVDYLVFGYAEIFRMTRRVVTITRCTQSHCILRHHPAAIGIIELIVAAAILQQFFCAPVLCKLCMFTRGCNRGEGKTKARPCLLRSSHGPY